MNRLGAFAYAGKLAPRIMQVRRKTWILLGLGLFATFAVAVLCTVVLVGWLWGQTQTLASGAPNLIRVASNAVLADANVLVPEVKKALNEIAAPAVTEANQALAAISETKQALTALAAPAMTEANQALAAMSETKQSLTALAAPAVTEANQALAAMSETKQALTALAAPAMSEANQTLDSLTAGKQALAALIPSVLATQIPAIREVSGSDLGPVPRYPGMQRTRWEQSGSKAVVEFEGSANFVGVLEHYRGGMAKLGYSEAVRAASAKRESHVYTLGGEQIQMELSQLPAGRVKVRIETLLAETARAELGSP